MKNSINLKYHVVLKLLVIVPIFSSCNLLFPEDFTFEDFVGDSYYHDFSTIFNIWKWEFSSKYDYQIVYTDKNKKNKCAKLFLRPNSRRSELALKYPSDYGYQVKYSWKFKLDDSFIFNPTPQTIHQFHDQPNFAIGEDWDNYQVRFPPIYTSLRDDTVSIMVNSINNGLREFSGVKINKGEWFTIEYLCYWTLDEDGFIEANINNNYVTPFNGLDHKHYMPTVYNKESNYFKVGLYRKPEIADLSIVYIDDFEMSIIH